jgi:AcrR family transcriptional regulator
VRTPARPRPRTRPPEERRSELMNAAQRLFLKQGVSSTTIEHITSGADVAKGTFYLYFSSREDILGALGERFAEQLLAGIKAAIAKTSEIDWKEKLATWAKAMATGYIDSIELHDIVFFGSRPSTREGRAGLTNNIIIDHLAELLQDGVDAGAWSIDDSRFTAVFLFSGVHGIVDDAYIQEKRLNRTRLMHRLEELCFRAVGLPSG